MVKIKGFLLFESSLGFMIACLGVSLLFLTIGQGKEVESKLEKRVDRALAHHIFEKTNLSETTIHGRKYQQSSGKIIIEQGKQYELK